MLQRKRKKADEDGEDDISGKSLSMLEIDVIIILGSEENQIEMENNTSVHHIADRSVDETKIKKICKLFSLKLIENAMESGYEPHEIARLATLVISQLDLSHKKAIKFIIRCCNQMSNPEFLSNLEDYGFMLDSTERIDVLYSLSADSDDFGRMIKMGIESEFISPDIDTVSMVHSFTLNLMMTITCKR